VSQTREVVVFELRDRPSIDSRGIADFTRIHQVEFAGVLLAQDRDRFAHLPRALLEIVNAYTGDSTVQE
jgi:hypothetical protein